MSENESVEGLVRAGQLDWFDTGGGNQVKVLRVSEETGAYSALFKAAAGTTNPPHRHLGPADFYVLSGSIEYRNGRAEAGDWIYEPTGALHEATHHPEETVYLANVYGPIAYLDADGNVASVSDGSQMKALLPR
ncbi:MAG: cupin domain-containing protein [Proteobacteria bacterium]|nr:cupin domain-containing protein [Pseudomonadota bacterium]